MAGVVGKSAFRSVLKAQSCQKLQIANASSKQSRAESIKQFLKNHKWGVALGTAAGSAVTIGTALTLSVSANVSLDLISPRYPWYHRQGVFNSFDHAGIRRGWQVYKQVCAACHSLNFVHYRDLVGVCLTQEEAKAEAAEAQIKDGPNEEGNYYLRPGKLADVLPAPYENVEAAKAANGGAIPPDLSYIAASREEGEDYIFSLLTGYVDPPPGMEPMPDLHYNCYFPGGWIGMAKALYNEIIEYEDGTPATTSQTAKDVAAFLRWTSEPWHDDRKRTALATFPLLVVAFLGSWYLTRKYRLALKSTFFSDSKQVTKRK